MDEEDPTQNIYSENKNSLLEKFFLKISGCGKVNAQNVDERLMTDDPEFNMNGDKIVQFVLHDFNNKPSLEEIEKSEEKTLSLLLIWQYKRV